MAKRASSPEGAELCDAETNSPAVEVRFRPFRAFENGGMPYPHTQGGAPLCPGLSHHAPLGLGQVIAAYYFGLQRSERNARNAIRPLTLHRGRNSIAPGNARAVIDRPVGAIDRTMPFQNISFIEQHNAQVAAIHFLCLNCYYRTT
jgi:hypothetical protein